MKADSVKTRSSNFELLRIFAMLLIVVFHYCWKAKWDLTAVDVSRRIWIEFFIMFGELGVNLFVLITGYFLIRIERIKAKKIIALILEIQFYNYLSLFILCGCDFSEFFLNLTYKDFFPTIYNQYWFATAYVLLYMLAPFLNKGLKALSQKEFKLLLSTVLAVWCVLPTVFGMKVDDTESLLYYNRFIWMIVLYITGAYLSLYSQTKRIDSKFRIYVLGGGTTLLIFAAICLIEMWPEFFKGIGISSAIYFWRPNTILMFLWSVSIFAIFKDMKVANSRIINRIASTTLGIYLLHEGKLVYRIWINILNTPSRINSRYLLFYILFGALAVFMAGMLVDLIRQALAAVLYRIFLPVKGYIKGRYERGKQ